jgi:HlyD family type I secretion membrane fusion protein
MTPARSGHAALATADAPRLPAPAGLGDIDRSIRRCVVAAAACIAALFGALGSWAAFAPLDSAAIAPGVVIVDSRRKTLQHLEGGIVKEILVRDGDAVEAGRVLVRLDDTRARANLQTVTGRYIAALAEWARLSAERDGLARMVVPAALSELAGYPGLAERIEAEAALFEARRTSLDGQMSILEQRNSQYRAEIAGIRMQVAGEERQLAILQEEIDIVAELLRTGNAQKPRLLALQRAHAQIGGSRGEHLAQIARIEQNIGETQLRKIDLRNRWLDEVVRHVREAHDAILDNQERRRAAADVLARLDVVAPQSGIVTNLKVYTVGGVIKPGEPILDIVPQDDRLVVEVRLQPDDIDVVRPGLEAQVRLTAYSARNADYLAATLTHVSADRTVDTRTGEAYYLGQVEVGEESLALLRGVRLYPGMSAEVTVRTGRRTALDYFIDPVRTSFHRAFRED